MGTIITLNRFCKFQLIRAVCLVFWFAFISRYTRISVFVEMGKIMQEIFQWVQYTDYTDFETFQ